MRVPSPPAKPNHEKMRKLLLLLSILTASIANVQGQTADMSAKIDSLLSLPGTSRTDLGANIAFFADALKGHGADTYYKKDSVASLRLNVETFTPITFINTVGALGYASVGTTEPSWREFAKELTELSCRRAENMGFSSLMWHASDWVGDNHYRGKIKELTENYSGIVEKTKSLDYLTRHRSEYAVLKDSATYEKVRMTEMGFRTHRVPTLKKETIKKKEVIEDLKDGDVIILNPQEDGIDIRVIGIVVRREDGPHLIYFSEEEGKVAETKDPLPSWMKLKTKYFNGYRILRFQN